MRKDRPHHFVLLAPGALFGIRCIVPRTMHRPLASLAFLYNIHDSWSGLASRSRLVCWRWDLGGGYTRCRGIRLWMWIYSCIGMLGGHEFGCSGPVCPLAAGHGVEMLELGLASSDFPSADVAAGALGPRVRRASVQMEAVGLWRPSLDPIMLA